MKSGLMTNGQINGEQIKNDLTTNELIAKMYYIYIIRAQMVCLWVVTRPK